LLDLSFQFSGRVFQQTIHIPKNITLPGQFQNPIENSWKEAKSINITPLIFLAWQRHFNER
jgi:hypothetical protein